MKLSFKFIFSSLLAFIFLFISCRKEEFVYIETPPEDILSPDALVTDFIRRIATNDGSIDNILDSANCFNIKFPVTVAANSVNIELTNENDYALVESVFDEDYTDTNTLNITFPITIIKADFSEEIVNNMTELMAQASVCNGENILDYDIECIDFIYPFSASKFNIANELILTETFINDKELYSFIETIAETDITTINFPINVQFADDSINEIGSLTELQSVITNEQNTCDEDDDYDHDDDDCNDCTPELLEEFLVGCQNWFTDKVRKNNFDYNSIYDGYDFNFSADGTVNVVWGSASASGTWTTSGTANDMFVLINIPGLPYCNNNWKLQEITTNGLTKIDLIINTQDRLRYRNSCN